MVSWRAINCKTLFIDASLKTNNNFSILEIDAPCVSDMLYCNPILFVWVVGTIAEELLLLVLGADIFIEVLLL